MIKKFAARARNLARSVFIVSFIFFAMAVYLYAQQNTPKVQTVVKTEKNVDEVKDQSKNRGQGKNQGQGKHQGQGKNKGQGGPQVQDKNKGQGWGVPDSVQNLKNPLAGDEKATKEGEKLFKTNCVTCHGVKGDGNSPLAASLNPKPKNLTAANVQGKTDGTIYWEITVGRPPMPSYKEILNENQRWSVINYIRELGKK